MKLFFSAMVLLCAFLTALAQPIGTPTVNFDPISVTTFFGPAFQPGTLPVAYMGPVDAAGNVYITYQNQIGRINSNGIKTTLAGTGTAGYVDGPVATAQFCNPSGLALDVAGNIYVGDKCNNVIRKITPGGVVSTLAGNGAAGNQDGTGTAASFNNPADLVADPAGNLFVLDLYNSAIRKISPAGVVTTFAVIGPSSSPTGLAIDNQGNIYVQQIYSNLLKITPVGVISEIYPPGFFGFKSGIAADKTGNLYVSSFSGDYVQIMYKIFPAIVAAPLAGSFFGYKDSIGTEAQFAGTKQITIDASGNLYVFDNNAIRKMSRPSLNFTANAGSASSSKYFNISANYLTGPANLQAPPGYELSLSEAGPYSTSLSTAPVAGEVHVLKVYIRLRAGIAEATYNDSVVLSSNGAVTQKLGVAGTVTHMPKKLVIIGSGTSACIGLDPATACYVGKVSSYYNKQAPFDTTIDNHLATGSTNCYNGMPSSYVSPYPAGSGYTPIKSINITAALALNPDVILVNYPTQNYDVLSVNEIMFCLRTIRDSANKKGVPCYITTTQPRTSPASFNTPAIKLKLATLKDSILAVFGNFAIDFYTGLINPADSSILYDQGDHTNMNATGHTILAQRVIARNVFDGTVTPIGSGVGLNAVYFNNTTLSDPAVVNRTDATINNNLSGVSPAPGFVNTDNYSVRWKGQVQPLYSETYTFYTNTDNGVRLWVNGVLLVDSWINQAVSEKTGTITLTGGQKYDITMEYYHLTGNAVSKLSWSSATTPKVIIPTTQLYLPALVVPPVPACSLNTAPQNGSTIATPTTATLTWTPVTGATSYYIFLWTGNTAPILPTFQTGGSTSYAVTGLSPSTVYNWYIVPLNSFYSAIDCGATNTTNFTTAPANANPGTGLQGVYYNGTNLSGTPLLTRIDPTINFDLSWHSPAPGIVPQDNYSVRWTGQVQALYSENYTFYTTSDDGIRLWVNGVQLVNDWMNQGATEYSGTIALAAGQKYDIVIEYYEAAGDAVTKLSWSSASTPKAIVPASQLYPPGSIACAVNSAPANGSTIGTQTLATLVWGTVAAAVSYDVYIWQGATAPPTPNANVSATSYKATGLTAGTLYHWYIVPRSASGTATGCAVTSTTSFTTAPNTAQGTGLQGVYYNGTGLSGTPLLTRIDPTINFDLSWHSPAPGIVPQDNYSVRWTGQVQALYSENYTFYTTSDDGIRLWVNGVQLVNDWMNQGATEYSGTIALAAGQKYDIVIEYYEAAGDAVTKLSWSSANTPKAIVPASQLYPPVAAVRLMDQALPASASPLLKTNESSSLPAITAVVSPNPVTTGQQAKLQINSNKVGWVVINVVGSNGAVISTKKINLASGLNTTYVNTHGLAQGFHVVNIVGSDKPLNLKLVVQ